MQQAGYTNASSTGENAFAYATSVDEAMQAFLIDWGVSDDGHRRNILQPDVSSSDAYQSVGIGIATTGPNSTVGPLVITQDFGSQPNQQAELVGVAYYDNQHTGMYEIGEGQGGVQIDATNLATGQTTSTQTWSYGRIPDRAQSRSVPDHRERQRHGLPDPAGHDRNRRTSSRTSFSAIPGTAARSTRCSIP